MQTNYDLNNDDLAALNEADETLPRHKLRWSTHSQSQAIHFTRLATYIPKLTTSVRKCAPK